MTDRRLTVAVVGHTNTGKTSLLRTLTRDVEFGEVSDRPATTRHVEGTALMVNGRALVELYDTPGLEDSIGLRDLLESRRGDQRLDGLAVVQQLLAGPDAHGRFTQEAKALRQVLGSDVALYVIDARDAVLAKHRDELAILGYCARPVVPVLNFVASNEARTSEWREHLARVNMHAVAEFDTVVIDEKSEQRLYEKMRSLLDGWRETLDALIDDRRRLRESLERASARLVAELLIDVAAHAVPVPIEQQKSPVVILNQFKQMIRRREQRCVDELLDLHRFRADDVRPDEFPIENGQWGLDLFNPQAMKQVGLNTGGGAAAGALAGLTIDAITFGTSLGAAAGIGAIVGAVLGAGRARGKQLINRARGFTELRCDDSTLRLLMLRQLTLVNALLHRGHASVKPVALDAKQMNDRDGRSTHRLPEELLEARSRSGWSSLGERGTPVFSAVREQAAARLADRLLRLLHQSNQNQNR